MQTIAKKLLSVCLWILAVTVVLLGALRLASYIRYAEFFNHSRVEFLIPGLTEDFVPQGFDYIAETDTFLTAGYVGKGGPARIYVRSGGKTLCTELFYEDGSAYDQHAGGICHNGDYLYVAGPTGTDVFSLADVLSGGDARLLGTIEIGHETAYCSIVDGYLFVGNFYYPEDYETPDAHRITTPAGDHNTAIMTVYRLDEAKPFGVDPVPVAAVSTREKVQGFCVTEDGQFVLSTSYGMSSSVLWFYRPENTRAGTVELQGRQVPLYYLDSANLVASVETLPMSEELVYKDGRIYVMNESGCEKYLTYGRYLGGYWVYSYQAK